MRDRARDRSVVGTRVTTYVKRTGRVDWRFVVRTEIGLPSSNLTILGAVQFRAWKEGGVDLRWF